MSSDQASGKESDACTHADEVADGKAVKNEQIRCHADDIAQVERIGVKTGNHLIDQFESVYWGVALSFDCFI